jgi:hypothetical protein
MEDYHTMVVAVVDCRHTCYVLIKSTRFYCNHINLEGRGERCDIVADVSGAYKSEKNKTELTRLFDILSTTIGSVI